MTQKYLILIFVIEVLISVFIVYSIRKTNEKILFYQEIVDRLQIRLPERLKGYRRELADLNHKIMRRSTIRPMSVQELGVFAGELLTEIIGLRFPVLSFKKMFGPIPLVLKLWQNRHRLINTFTKTK